jgi:hypothetical protein
MKRRWLAGALVLVGACNIPGRRAYNLDELHDAQGRHKYRAALLGDVEYLLREGFGGALRSMGSSLREKEPTKIDDPVETCLENLLGLVEANPRDPEVSALQVELCARIASTDVSPLSRERAVIALGSAGERLGGDHPLDRARGERTLNAEELGDLLARYVKAVTPYVAGGSGEQRENARAEIEKLVAETRSYEYDAAGLPRILRGVRLLVGRLGRDFPSLASLASELQGRAIVAGLEHGLADRDPRVAAAAVGAGRLAFGDAWCARTLALVQKGQASNDVLIAVADDVASRGLPSGADGERLLRLCYELSGGHSDGRVRTAAMRALETASGGASHSLREEDWQRWWAAREASSTSSSPAPKKAAESTPP